VKATIKKMPMRQERAYVSLRDRQKRRQQGVIYNFAVILLLFLIAINLLGSFQNPSDLTMTDLDIAPLNFREVEPVARWHGEERQIAYLTFNSTPSANTEAILDVLAAQNVTATFFVQLERLQNFPDAAALMSRIVAEGHFIGLDFVSHHQDGNAAAMIQELEANQQLVYELSGLRSYLARPLFGSFHMNLSGSHQEALLGSDFRIWDWHVDSHDWQSGISTEQVVGAIENGLNAWGQWPNQAVVSFQELDITVESLPQVIHFLRNQGYHLGAYEPASHFSVNLLNNPNL